MRSLIAAVAVLSCASLSVAGCVKYDTIDRPASAPATTTLIVPPAAAPAPVLICANGAAPPCP